MESKYEPVSKLDWARRDQAWTLLSLAYFPLESYGYIDRMTISLTIKLLYS